MVSKEAVELVRRFQAIRGRYDEQELIRVGRNYRNARKNWTPKQRRRMFKKSKGYIVIGAGK